MTGKTATIIGATGLIGSHLLQQLLGDSDYQVIKVIVRRQLSISHPKVQVVVIDFADLSAFRKAIAGSNVVFCAVGTTRQKVKGDKEAYRKVDYDIPVTAAKFCAETGVGQFLLVSSIGANSQSSAFYTRLKGEVEEAIQKLELPSVSVFRPSLLLGDRQEARFGEKIAEVIMKPLTFLLPSRYKPIQASDVASSMIRIAKMNHPGFRIYFHDEMIRS